MNIKELTKQVMNTSVLEAQDTLHEELSSYKFNEVLEEVDNANICFSYEDTDANLVGYNKEKRELRLYFPKYDETHFVPISYLGIFEIMDIMKDLI